MWSLNGDIKSLFLFLQRLPDMLSLFCFSLPPSALCQCPLIHDTASGISRVLEWESKLKQAGWASSTPLVRVDQVEMTWVNLTLIDSASVWMSAVFIESSLLETVKSWRKRNEYFKEKQNRNYLLILHEMLRRIALHSSGRTGLGGFAPGPSAMVDPGYRLPNYTLTHIGSVPSVSCCRFTLVFSVAGTCFWHVNGATFWYINILFY